MAEQLEIVIGANVDDAKAGINSLGQTINQFAQQGKLSIGVLEQSLAQLKAQIRITTDPIEAQKLGLALKAVQDQLTNLKLNDGLAQNLGGVTRATRTAHLELDQMSQSIRGIADGSQRGVDVLSNLVFTFERLRGQTGSATGALSALGESLLGPAGIVLAITTLLPLVQNLLQEFIGGGEEAKKFQKDVDELKKSLDKLREPINIVIQTAIGSTGGEVNRIQTLIAQATAIEKQAGIETEASIQRRKNALASLTSSYNELFNNIKFERSLTEANARAIEDAGNREIDILKRKAAEAAIDKTVSNAQETVNSTKAQIDALNDELTERLKILGTTREQIKLQIEARDEAIKTAKAQADSPIGFIIPKFEPIIGEKDIADFNNKLKTLSTGLREAKIELARHQIVQTDIISEQVLNGDVFEKAKTAITSGLTELQRLLVDKAKRDQGLFTIPLEVLIDPDQVAKEQLRLARLIEQGIKQHFIEIGGIELPVRLKTISVDKIELPKLIPEIDKPGFKESIKELTRGLTIPLTIAVDEPSLLETEDQVKKIFSGFSDTNIFTEFGRNAGTKFREALLESVKIFDKGFVINPQIDVSDVIASLTASLAGIKDIQLKVIRTETFDQAIRTLRDLHDAGVEAGNAVEKAFLDAGKSSADAVKAGKAVENAFGGITKQVADVADAVNTTLTSAFQDFFKAVETGKNPIKAFFEAIISSVEQVASKLIGSAIEKALLSLITTTTAVTTAVSASATAVAGAAAASVGAAGTAAAAAAGATTAAAAASAAAVAAIAAAAAAKIALASVNPLSLLGLIGLGFAEGGEPPVNQPSIVGEKGWELFVPKVPGTIYSHADSMKLVSNASVKEHESIKEYLIAEKVSQQIKEHFTAAFKSVESSIKVLVTNNERLATYSYHLRDTIQSLKETSINNATIVRDTKSYENSFDRIEKVIIKNLTSTGIPSNKFTEKFNTVDKSVTIERIINNNFYTSHTSDILKQMSLTDLQHTFHIPAFASGGAVFGPTLAILGEGFGISRSNPEFVGTANQLRGIQGGAFDVNVNVGGELSFSMGKLAIALNREVRSQLRTSGKPPF